MQPKLQRSLDGFIRRPTPVLRRQLVRPPRRPLPQPRRIYVTPQPVPQSKKRLPAWLQMSLILVLAMLAGILAQSVVLGQLAIIIYGLAALIWSIPSRTTFTLALLSMATTIILLVGFGNAALAQNFATYTFLLLTAGVISLGRELKKEGGRVYSIRERNISW